MARAGEPIITGNNSFMTGLDSSGYPEAADFSTTDHEFSAPARMLRVVASGTATLTCRPHGASADISVTLAAGIEYLPFVVTHIRNSGTTASLEIIGIL